MTTLELSAEVNAPIWRVYQQWRSFDRVAPLISSITKVRHVGLARIAWREEQNGLSCEMDCRITVRPAENLIIWNSLTATQYSCIASCQPRSAGKTLLTLKIQYLADEQWQHPNAVFKRHMRYLNAFQETVEARESEVGGGQAQKGEVPCSAN